MHKLILCCLTFTRTHGLEEKNLVSPQTIPMSSTASVKIGGLERFLPLLRFLATIPLHQHAHGISTISFLVAVV